jgi:hypothetical protein
MAAKSNLTTMKNVVVTKVQVSLDENLGAPSTALQKVPKGPYTACFPGSIEATPNRVNGTFMRRDVGRKLRKYRCNFRP